jgi:antibiotic biosynthesis monooxygenase (ABM) superfamily enzyme
MNEPIHIAVTRRIKPGCEAEFQQALREFFQSSLSHAGVQGASMLMPPPGSNSPEIGILRTFTNAGERDAFYASPEFKAWEKRIKPLTEGEPVRRQLNGLEAWFRDPQPVNPPRWKMALLTFIAVWPVSMAVPALLNPLIGTRVSNVLFAGAVAAGIVLVLTWVAMPLLVRFAQPWLQPKS